MTFLMGGGGGGLYTSVGGGLIFGMLIGLHIWGAYIRGKGWEVTYGGY